MYVESSMTDIFTSPKHFDTVDTEIYGKSKVNIEVNNTDLCRFLVDGVTASELNLLRQTLMSKIAVMAIDVVEIVDNESAIPDESIATRMGLIPIVCKELDKFSYLEDCFCEGEGCEKCGISFSLDVTNTSSQKLLVSSDDIVFSDKRFHVLPGNRFPIVYLRQNSRIRLCGWVLKGKGCIHSKWCPVSAVYFKDGPRKGTYRFTFESIGLLTNAQLLEKAFQILYS